VGGWWLMGWPSVPDTYADEVVVQGAACQMNLMSVSCQLC
jgi:hypothetical protein